MTPQEEQGTSRCCQTVNLVSDNSSGRWGRTVRAALVRPWMAWLLLGIGLLATVLVSLVAWQQTRVRDDARFFARTEALRAMLLQEFDRYVRVLQSARALWEIHPPVGQDEWRRYVQSLDLSNSFPGLQAMAYVERVPSDRLRGFVEQVRRADPDFLDFQVHPQSSSDEHYLVRFIEPLDYNRAALGYDIGSEPLRRQAAEQARDTGKATLTHRIALVQAPQAPGVLLLLPVYSTGLQTTNVALRRSALIGWIDVVFVVEDLLAAVYSSGSEGVEIQVFDGTVMSPAAQLAGGQKLPGSGAEPSRASFERIARLDCGNTTWTLRFRAGPAFSQTRWFSAPGYISAAGLGLCISLLLFGIARSLAITKLRAQALADEMTAKLRLQHHAMASVNIGLFILDATRDDCPIIIYANPAFERMTGYSVDKPLGHDTLQLLRNGVDPTALPGLTTALQTAGREQTVVREYRRDGSQFWAEFRLLPVMDERGCRTHFLGIVENVTERRRAKDQLARAEQRYLELVNNLKVGVYRNTAGEKGHFVEMNPALLAMFEAASKEELLGHSLSDRFVDPARRNEFLDKLFQVGFVKDEEVEIKSLRGRNFWGAVTATIKTDEQGASFFDGVVVDITERKVAEEAVRNSEARLRAILENAPDGIITIDERGLIQSLNPAALQIFGYAAAELVGRNVKMLMPSPYREEHDQYLAQYCATGVRKIIGIGREVMGRRKDGSVFPLDLSVSEVQSSGRRIFTGILRDITRRKEAEQALQESQERFALAVQGTNDGIWDWNVVTNEVYFSPRWKSMLGYEEDEVENTFAGWERLLHPEERARSLGAIQAYFSGQSDTYELEHRLRQKDGTYRWVLARGVALRDAQGKPLRMAGSHVDLSGRKQVEEQLRAAYEEVARSQETLQDTVKQLRASHEELQQTQRQLIQAAKMECIGTLAAGIAHEVKNPLQIILMGLEYLNKALPAPSPNVELVLSDMQDGVQRANRIVRELLQLSANTAFELKEGDLNGLVERAFRLLNSELAATRTNLVCRLEPGLPAVGMDAGKIEQVMLNLLINALQAMTQEGTLRVTTRSGRLGQDLQLTATLASLFAPGERIVVVEIQDTGPGIPTEHLARIFDPFFTTKAVGTGTGLGLSIVKKIIDLHKGGLEIQNVPEGGVLVTLALRAWERELP